MSENLIMSAQLNPHPESSSPRPSQSRRSKSQHRSSTRKGQTSRKQSDQDQCTIEMSNVPQPQSAFQGGFHGKLIVLEF